MTVICKKLVIALALIVAISSQPFAQALKGAWSKSSQQTTSTRPQTLKDRRAGKKTTESSARSEFSNQTGTLYADRTEGRIAGTLKSVFFKVNLTGLPKFGPGDLRDDGSGRLTQKALDNLKCNSCASSKPTIQFTFSPNQVRHPEGWNKAFVQYSRTTAIEKGKHMLFYKGELVKEFTIRDDAAALFAGVPFAAEFADSALMPNNGTAKFTMDLEDVPVDGTDLELQLAIDAFNSGEIEEMRIPSYSGACERLFDFLGMSLDGRESRSRRLAQVCAEGLVGGSPCGSSQHAYGVLLDRYGCKIEPDAARMVVDVYGLDLSHLQSNPAQGICYDDPLAGLDELPVSQPNAQEKTLTLTNPGGKVLAAVTQVGREIQTWTLPTSQTQSQTEDQTEVSLNLPEPASVTLEGVQTEQETSPAKLLAVALESGGQLRFVGQQLESALLAARLQGLSQSRDAEISSEGVVTNNPMAYVSFKDVSHKQLFIDAFAEGVRQGKVLLTEELTIPTAPWFDFSAVASAKGLLASAGTAVCSDPPPNKVTYLAIGEDFKPGTRKFKEYEGCGFAMPEKVVDTMVYNIEYRDSYGHNALTLKYSADDWIWMEDIGCKGPNRITDKYVTMTHAHTAFFVKKAVYKNGYMLTFERIGMSKFDQKATEDTACYCGLIFKDAYWGPKPTYDMILTTSKYPIGTW